MFKTERKRLTRSQTSLKKILNLLAQLQLKTSFKTASIKQSNSCVMPVSKSGYSLEIK